jgi:hypothetical protein
MKSLFTKTGKIILGILLFVVGIGLFYAGCKYISSGVSGFLKKLDIIVYIICFGTALFGAGMFLEALGLMKSIPKKEDVS